MPEYPRPMYSETRGVAPRVVYSDAARDQALNDGFTRDQPHPADAPVSAEAIDQARREAQPDPNMVERYGAARADHEAKQNAEADVKRRDALERDHPHTARDTPQK